MAAAAEARRVCQCTANRYFAEAAGIVSGCRPSVSASSSKKPETIPANNRGNRRFPLSKERPMFSDLSPDSRWWLFTNSLSKESSFELVDMNMDMKFQDTRELPWWQMRVNQNDLGPKEKEVRESESSKGKMILEALRHSQTRARKAEKAAKEAYAEKEDVMKMVLRQASELFACRRWIHFLQLQNLYYQIKINNNNKMNPMSSVCNNGKSQKKMKKKKKVGKRRSRGGYEDYNLGKFAVVVAMGLGVVGAGLLLGWTVGWMFI